MDDDELIALLKEANRKAQEIVELLERHGRGHALDRDLALARDLASALALARARAFIFAEDSVEVQARPSKAARGYFDKLESIWAESDLSLPLGRPSPVRSMFGNVSFPAQTVIGAPYALQVQIAADKRDSLAPLLEVAFDKGGGVHVNVVVAFYDNAFAIDGSNLRSVVVTANNEPDPVIFHLTPKKEGKQRLYVDFFQEHRYLGRREVRTEVAPAEATAMVRLASRAAAPSLTPDRQPKPASAPLSLSPQWRAPDLLIIEGS